jgi:hypothetical protein
VFAGSIPSRGRIELVQAPEPTLMDEQGVVIPGSIIFQPELACLCGSDLPYFDSNNEHGPYPHRVGHSLHEMIGTVVATSGQRFAVGQKVLAVPINQVGFFERYRLSEDRAIPLDPRKPPEQALLAQPLGTVIYALKKPDVQRLRAQPGRAADHRHRQAREPPGGQQADGRHGCGLLGHH